MTTIVMLVLATAFVLTVLAYLVVDTGGIPAAPSASTSVVRRVRGRWR